MGSQTDEATTRKIPSLLQFGQSDRLSWQVHTHPIADARHFWTFCQEDPNVPRNGTTANWNPVERDTSVFGVKIEVGYASYVA